MTNAAKRSLPILKPRSTSFVVYRGSSAINGAPIVAILTGADGSSANIKTGPMAQLWILAANVAPHEAQKTGDDASSCGDCRLRPANAHLRKHNEKGCYVATFQGPRSTWQAHRSTLEDLDGAADMVRRSDIGVRLGAYGDPAALPEAIVARLARAARGRVTGYTHQWRRKHAGWLKAYCMASTETSRDAAIARASSWRTFRAMPVGVDVESTEVLCPSTTKAMLTCNSCGLCDGKKAAGDSRRSIAIFFH